MSETNQPPKFVLISWPAWWHEEPRRSAETDFYVGLVRDESHVSVLDGPYRKAIDAVERMRDPDKLRAALNRDWQAVKWQNDNGPTIHELEIATGVRVKPRSVDAVPAEQATGLFEASNDGSDPVDATVVDVAGVTRNKSRNLRTSRSAPSR